jgi:2-(1,2-epoxy-1,2-dihydrophenyl)acetyl-CoA isomerase
MHSYTSLLVEQNGGVLEVTLNRPEKYNALNTQVSNELVAVCEWAANDDTIRCILLTGAGNGFCAGQDLSEVANRGETFSFTEHLETAYNKMVRAMRALEKPIVVAVNGACAGAGLGLALAGDIRYASEKAKFLPAFIGLGLVPDTGVSYWLPRLVGVHRAAEFLFTNERVSGDEAVALGFANKIFPDDKLLDAARALAQKFAVAPTLGIGMTKRLLNQSLTATFDEQLDAEGILQNVVGHSADYREGVAAFYEKRTPVFIGK